MDDLNYQTLYQRAYRRKKKQVTVTLDLDLYRIWQERARVQGRSIPGQIMAEAEAYRLNKVLPSRAAEFEFQQFVRIVRGIANNWNQIAHNSNRFARLLEERRARHLLRELEDTARKFVFGRKLNRKP